MNIVGGRDDTELECGVQTIDIWFSQRRQTWIVERVDAEGNQVGAAHLCGEADVAACVADWLRAHEGIEYVTPHSSHGRRTAVEILDLGRRHAAKRRPPTAARISESPMAAALR